MTDPAVRGASREGPQFGEWQPIDETVPRNEDVIVYADGIVGQARLWGAPQWDPEFWCWDCIDAYVAVDSRTGRIYPTHWMPLPPAPSTDLHEHQSPHGDGQPSSLIGDRPVAPLATEPTAKAGPGSGRADTPVTTTEGDVKQVSPDGAWEVRPTGAGSTPADALPQQVKGNDMRSEQDRCNAVVSRVGLIQRAAVQRAEIEQIFTDCASWNDNARQPHELPVDADPDGSLRRLADGLDRMLKSELARI